MKAATTPRHLQALQPQREARAALRSGQFQLHYQPVVDLDNFTIRAVEALLRWNHPVGGLLPPDDFLPGLAQTPVMREITRHVLSEAGRAARHWPDWRIAVNVAATDVVHPRFADVVLAAIDETQMPPSQLVLELTEQSVLHDVGRATANLTKLRDLGVRIALDDFGTGYSSLLYLRDLPISSVKVDRTFVSSIETYDENAAIVESVVRLAKSIGLRVVAEGVETPTQVRFLRSIECDAAQGFLFGRPVPACELAADARPCWTPEKTEGRPRPLTSRRRRPLARQSAGWTPTSDPEIIAEVRQMLGAGASLHTIAAALNRAGSTTEHGARWSSQTVARLVNSLPSSG